MVLVNTTYESSLYVYPTILFLNEKDLIVFCSPVSKVVGSTDATGDQNKIRSLSLKYVLGAKSEYDFDS